MLNCPNIRNGDTENKNTESMLNEDENKAREGCIGMILSRPARISLLDWSSISDQLLTVRVNTSIRNTTNLQCELK